MTKVYLTLAATIAVAATSPALATAVAPAATAPKAAAPAQQTLTRAGLTKNLDSTFKAIDTNGDGTLSTAEISAAEMKVLQHRAGAVRSRLEAEFTKLDTNNDGQPQQGRVHGRRAARADDRAQRRAASQLDKNKDGKVSLQEYHAPPLATFNKLDSNHDGTVTHQPRQRGGRRPPQVKRKEAGWTPSGHPFRAAAVANYQNIVRLRPEVREFIRNRRWVHRGDVITYGPNIAAILFRPMRPAFATASSGARRLSVADCLSASVTASSSGRAASMASASPATRTRCHRFLPSALAFPSPTLAFRKATAAISIPCSLAFVARAKRPPSAVVHISGGDYTNFCYTSIADPVFGSPNLKQIEMVLKERGGRPPAERQIGALLAFTSLWIRAIVELCHLRSIPLVLADDTTFFEKREPSDIERECELGKPFNPAQIGQFDTHKRFVADYHSRRKALAAKLRVPLAGPGKTNDIGFIDEFHYDREGTRTLCDDFAGALEPLL